MQKVSWEDLVLTDRGPQQDRAKLFEKNLEDIGPFRGPLTLLFWTSGDVCPPWVSKPGWIPFAYFLLCVILRFTSGVTPADCVEVSMAAESF